MVPRPCGVCPPTSPSGVAHPSGKGHPEHRGESHGPATFAGAVPKLWVFLVPSDITSFASMIVTRSYKSLRLSHVASCPMGAPLALPDHQGLHVGPPARQHSPSAFPLLFFPALQGFCQAFPLIFLASRCSYHCHKGFSLIPFYRGGFRAKKPEQTPMAWREPHGPRLGAMLGRSAEEQEWAGQGQGQVVSADVNGTIVYTEGSEGVSWVSWGIALQ